MTIPYRQVDHEHRRRAAIAEAARLREALAMAPRVYHMARGRISSSQEIIDVLTICIEELSL